MSTPRYAHAREVPTGTYAPAYAPANGIVRDCDSPASSQATTGPHHERLTVVDGRVYAGRAVHRSELWRFDDPRDRSRWT